MLCRKAIQPSIYSYRLKCARKTRMVPNDTLFNPYDPIVLVKAQHHPWGAFFGLGTDPLSKFDMEYVCI
jgi:hypothetical protein